MATSTKQIYYPKLWWRILPLFIFIVFTLFYIKLCFPFFQSDLMGHELTLLSMTIVLVYFAFFAYLFGWKTRLIVEQEGLRVEGLYAGTVHWEDILEIGSDTYSQLGMPRIHTWGIIYNSDSTNRKNQTKFLPLGHIIPRPPHQKVEMLVVLMGIDWEKFAQTDFGKALYEHAPQLFPQS